MHVIHLEMEKTGKIFKLCPEKRYIFPGVHHTLVCIKLSQFPLPCVANCLLLCSGAIIGSEDVEVADITATCTAELSEIVRSGSLDDTEDPSIRGN